MRKNTTERHTTKKSSLEMKREHRMISISATQNGRESREGEGEDAATAHTATQPMSKPARTPESHESWNR